MTEIVLEVMSAKGRGFVKTSTALRCEERAGKRRQDGLRFRRVLIQGAADPYRSGEREGLQSPPRRVHHGRAKPSQITSHRLKLAEGPDAYKHFDTRDDGWAKVVLTLAA